MKIAPNELTLERIEERTEYADERFQNVSKYAFRLCITAEPERCVDIDITRADADREAHHLGPRHADLAARYLARHIAASILSRAPEDVLGDPLE